MSTKSDNLLRPSSCLNKTRNDEPLFILRANDPTAPQTVRLWAAMNADRRSPDKLAEAMHVAEDMEKWNASQPKVAMRDMPAPAHDVMVQRARGY